MKLTLLVALAMFMSVSCKTENAKKDDQTPDQGNQPITVPQERSFTESETTIGKRICSSLKKKRELFETLTNMEKQFRFKAVQTDCGAVNPTNISEFTAAISNASASEFEYVSSRSNYFRDVITDQTGVMKTYCDAFAGNGAVSNQTTNGSSIIRLNLLINNGFDTFEVVKMNKDNSIVSTEAVAVINQTSQAGVKFFGVEKERVRYTRCSGAVSKQYSVMRQTWLKAETPF